MQKQFKEDLKELTFPFHQWLEESEIFDEIKNKTLKKDSYVLLLIKLYQFIQVLEKDISKYKSDFKHHGLNDIEERLEKTKWLKEDLDYLNIKVTNKNIEFKTLDSFSSAIGALYVIEGSTMGGLQITKMIKSQYKEELPLRYYQSYKEQTMPKWVFFAQWLNNTQEDKYNIILCASEIFIQLKKHLEKRD